MKNWKAVLNRVAFVMWRTFAYVFLLFGVWLTLNLWLTGEYVPSAGMGDAPKAWQLVWDMRGLVLGPAIWMAPGLLFWWLSRKVHADSEYSA